MTEQIRTDGGPYLDPETAIRRAYKRLHTDLNHRPTLIEKGPTTSWNIDWPVNVYQAMCSCGDSYTGWGNRDNSVPLSLITAWNAHVEQKTRQSLGVRQVSSWDQRKAFLVGTATSLRVEYEVWVFYSTQVPDTDLRSNSWYTMVRSTFDWRWHYRAISPTKGEAFGYATRQLRRWWLRGMTVQVSSEHKTHLGIGVYAPPPPLPVVVASLIEDINQAGDDPYRLRQLLTRVEEAETAAILLAAKREQLTDHLKGCFI